MKKVGKQLKTKSSNKNLKEESKKVIKKTWHFDIFDLVQKSKQKNDDYFDKKFSSLNDDKKETNSRISLALY